MTAWTILLFVAAAFVGYAIYTYYGTTSGTTPKRVWASLVAAAAAIAGWLVSFFQPPV